MSIQIMAAGNFGSPMQLLILLIIVLIFFGGSRLRSLGGDLGAAIKGFKNSMSDGDKAKEEQEQEKLQADSARIIDGRVVEPTKTSAEHEQRK